MQVKVKSRISLNAWSPILMRNKEHLETETTVVPGPKLSPIKSEEKPCGARQIHLTVPITPPSSNVVHNKFRSNLTRQRIMSPKSAQQMNLKLYEVKSRDNKALINMPHLQSAI